MQRLLRRGTHVGRREERHDARVRDHEIVIAAGESSQAALLGVVDQGSPSRSGGVERDVKSMLSVAMHTGSHTLHDSLRRHIARSISVNVAQNILEEVYKTAKALAFSFVREFAQIMRSV